MLLLNVPRKAVQVKKRWHASNKLKGASIMRLYEGRLVGRHRHTITPLQLHQEKDVNPSLKSGTVTKQATQQHWLQSLSCVSARKCCKLSLNHEKKSLPFACSTSHMALGVSWSPSREMFLPFSWDFDIMQSS